LAGAVTTRQVASPASSRMPFLAGPEASLPAAESVGEDCVEAAHPAKRAAQAKGNILRKSMKGRIAGEEAGFNAGVPLEFGLQAVWPEGKTA